MKKGDYRIRCQLSIWDGEKWIISEWDNEEEAKGVAEIVKEELQKEDA